MAPRGKIISLSPDKTALQDKAASLPARGKEGQGVANWEQIKKLYTSRSLFQETSREQALCILSIFSATPASCTENIRGTVSFYARKYNNNVEFI
jgi:hypothetical protein